ncbi:hypothetical protein EDB85DRAFT_1896695 [Lactarius pseudohatsudake]|nr:hypothetical protein EDB85DRAFT_1896695 [Lactarius pseudohatsudake]
MAPENILTTCLPTHLTICPTRSLNLWSGATAVWVACTKQQKTAHWTYGGAQPSWNTGTPTDEDDGSGMGWVKRRREELLLVDHNITTVTLSQPTPENNDDEEDEEETKYDSLDDKLSGTEQDNDDDAEEQHFKQVLGAGVEHISRHRTLTAQKLHDDGDDMKQQQQCDNYDHDGDIYGSGDNNNDNDNHESMTTATSWHPRPQPPMATMVHDHHDNDNKDNNFNDGR